MDQETFNANPIWFIAYLIIVITGLVFFYFFIIVKPLFILPFPAWLLLFLFLPLIRSLINVGTTKLIIDGDTLHFDRGIFSQQKEKVSLLEVSEITAKSDWGSDHKIHTRIICMIDKKGHLIYVIPGHLIGFWNIKRFKAAVLVANPNIRIEA